MNTLCIPLILLFFVIVGIIVSLNKRNNSANNTREYIDPDAEGLSIEDIVQLDMIDDEWEDDR